MRRTLVTVVRSPGRVAALVASALVLAWISPTSASAAIDYNVSTVSWPDIPYSVKSRSGAILNTGNLSSDFTKSLLSAYSQGKIKRVKNTSTGAIRHCHLDGRFIEGLYRLTVLKGYQVTVSSTNRWCDWDSSDTSSFHVKYGGGGAIDIGSFVAPGKSRNEANYESTAKRQEIDALIGEFMYAAGAGADRTKWQIGQSNCRTSAESKAWSSQGYLVFSDTCNHIHLSYSGSDRSYPY